MTSLEIFLAILSAVASVCAIVFGAKAFRRGQKQDDSAAAATLATMQADLRYVREKVDDIVDESTEHRSDISGLKQQQAATDKAVGLLTDRVDRLEKKVFA